MKLFFLIGSMAKAHGVERTLADKINYMAEAGHDVTLVTYEQGRHAAAFEISYRVRHIDLDCRFFTLYRLSMPRRVVAAFMMRQRFRQRLETLVSRLVPDAIVVTTYTWEFMRPIMSLRHRTHIIVEAHTAFNGEMTGRSWLDWSGRHMYLHTLKECHLLIALTNSDAAAWRRYIPRVAVVGNAVSYYCEDISHLQRERGRIVAAGRYHVQKRFDRLIDAFALVADRFPEWHVDIFGEGPEQQRLQQRIDSLQMAGRIRLCPATQDIFSEFKRSEMFVFSSDYEGYGLVLIEAMACGVAPVSTDCPCGPSEIIEDGKTGLLAKMEAADLADKMAWLMGHDAERHLMAQRAHAAAARFRKEQVMPQWEQAYASVMG